VITNLTRMPQRRVDLTVAVPLRHAAGEDNCAVLAAIRELLRADPGVHKGQIVVSLADFGDWSLRAQVLYFTADPDWESHMAVRERSTSRSSGSLRRRGSRFAHRRRPGGASRASGGSA
jgi:small-conductance mechanosensitive channel